MDIFKKAKKYGIDVCSSDGIDDNTFHKRVKDAEDSSRASKAFWVSLASMLIALTALLHSIYRG